MLSSAAGTAAFDYAAPSTVAEALDLLAGSGDDARVLAGGQSLVPMLNYGLARPRLVVDITRLPLAEVTTAGDRLRLGALARHATLEESPLVGTECPLLREAAALIGNARVRALGTLGGSLAHADPAAELPLAVVALDGLVTVEGRAGRRSIPAARFFTGHLTTALEPAELLVEVDVPRTARAGCALEELSRRPGDFALVAVAAVLALDRRGIATDVRIAVGGAGPCPVRVPAAEDVLRGHEPTPERVAQAAARARAAVDPPSDPFASASYRRLLVGVLARRALMRAAEQSLEVAS